MDRQQLLESHVRLLQRCKLEERRNEDLRGTVRRLNNSLIERNEAQRRLLELQQAHAAHCAFEGGLQKQLFDAQLFKSACRRQELAISKLEDLRAQCRAQVWGEGRRDHD